jgi:DNA replication protein DnaC
MEGYKSSGIGNLIKNQNFNNFSLECYKSNPEHYKIMNFVYNTLKSYACDFKARKNDNFILFGGTGLGKTHLSSAVAGRVIESGFDVIYVSVVEMLSDFEHQRFGSSGYSNEGNNVNRYYNADLLIIDDLGSEITNQFTTSCIYNLINTRLNKKVSTIISSNLNQNELRARYWDRITSRIFGEYTPLVFVGKDIRMQKLGMRDK